MQVYIAAVLALRRETMVANHSATCARSVTAVGTRAIGGAGAARRASAAAMVTAAARASASVAKLSDSRSRRPVSGWSTRYSIRQGVRRRVGS
jgi:hypothetical protein